MNWTDEQQKVINTRNKNVLVSAAAGSGKTAVLVERIIQMITDEKNPIDIDHLLVVTFTKAAAAQMKERIGKAIEKKLTVEPENENLRRQNILLQSANIMTIHSFCLNVVKNYFHMIELDPGFKLAEETDVALLQSDLIEELLEEEYDTEDESFHQFIETYASSKSDAPVAELILKLYRFSMSYPWPKEWLDSKVKNFNLQSIEEMEKTDWMQILLGIIQGTLADLRVKADRMRVICNEWDGPEAYLPAVVSDLKLIDSMMECNSYMEYSKRLGDISFARLSTKKQEGVSEDKKNEVKLIRDSVKKGLKDISEQFFFANPEDMLSDISNSKNVMKVLFDLTAKFMDKYAAKKADKNLIDFNDLEHFALKILVKKEGEKMTPSSAAIELRGHFEEILIDEYQDSNLVQETILTSVSKESIGKPNRFMVGDIKQSIYKFRLAMPELFMEKYNSYSIADRLEDGSINLTQRIDLDKNFRSRDIVLESINGIFYQIMKRSVGGIDYDERAALKAGAFFPEPEDEDGERSKEQVELLLIGEDTVSMRMATDPFYTDEQIERDIQEREQHESEMQQNVDQQNMSEASSDEEDAVMELKAKELEARALVKRIQKLTDEKSGLMVYDDEIKKYRLCRYSDIVILLRTMTGWADVFVNTLMAEGIPAYADTSTGYFQTVEVRTMVNMLRIIDNPRQDIPLAAVLYSPIVKMTSEELAILHSEYAESSLYRAAEQFVTDYEGQAESRKISIYRKLKSLLSILEEYRELLTFEPISEVLLRLMKKTGYYYYVSAMPGGDRRRANLDLLVSYATQFEKGSYKGLFHFVRYLEKIHTYQMDFGEAQTASNDSDEMVRIMSIHKSKGLEFPVCIVAGLSKQFNMQDFKSKLILHPELGAGPEYIDLKERVKAPTLIKKIIQKQVLIENIGEELRVLYVALTRAKEKLIMSGMFKDKALSSREFSYFDLIGKKNYMEYVLPAVVNYILNQAKNGNSDIPLQIKYQETKELIDRETVKQIFELSDQEFIQSIDESRVYDEVIHDKLQSLSEFNYAHQDEAGLKFKVSVSELKKEKQKELQKEILMAMAEKEEDMYAQEELITEPETLTLLPQFMQAEEEASGAARGTIYHKIFELLPIDKIKSQEDLKTFLTETVNAGKLTAAELDVVEIKFVYEFINSGIGRRMAEAAARGELFREKQFVIGIPACDIMAGCKSQELILIQGIIDAFFLENNEIVLVDYKSDHIPVHEGDDFLVNRYKAQMDYYERALEKISGHGVKEKIIYSIRRKKEILVSSYHEEK